MPRQPRAGVLAAKERRERAGIRGGPADGPPSAEIDTIAMGKTMTDRSDFLVSDESVRRAAGHPVYSAPSMYFPRFMIGYLEGIESECGIARRVARGRLGNLTHLLGHPARGGDSRACDLVEDAQAFRPRDAPGAIHDAPERTGQPWTRDGPVLGCRPDDARGEHRAPFHGATRSESPAKFDGLSSLKGTSEAAVASC